MQSVERKMEAQSSRRVQADQSAVSVPEAYTQLFTDFLHARLQVFRNDQRSALFRMLQEPQWQFDDDELLDVLQRVVKPCSEEATRLHVLMRQSLREKRLQANVVALFTGILSAYAAQAHTSAVAAARIAG